MQLGLPFDASPACHDTAPPPHAAARPSLEDAPLYFVRQRRARRYVLRVDFDGRVRVTIPRGGSKKEGEAFARRQREWIARQRARCDRVTLSREQRDALRARAATELPARLLELARVHAYVGESEGTPLRVTRVTVRNQRTRWGSCGRDGHICLNWRLLLMPDTVRDYVLLHELMHLRRLDHSRAFWALVAAACPTYQDARRWLREHGGSLR